MQLSEVIFHLGLKGSRTHRDYNSMVSNWYIEENNPIPSYELCLDTWNNVTLPKITNQRKLELITEVKELANEILRLNYDWKVSKQFTTNYWTSEQFEVIKQEMQNIRIKSNQIENEILALNTLDEVNNYNIEF